MWTDFSKFFHQLIREKIIYRVRQNKTPHCAKCITVAVVLNFPAKFLDTVPGIVYRLQY